MTTLRIQPTAKTVSGIGTLTSPMVHGDPNELSKPTAGNAKLFNAVEMPRTTQPIVNSDRLIALASSLPILPAMQPLLETLDVADYIAVHFAYRFLLSYNGRGLLDGTNRYSLFEDRLRYAAQSRVTMFGFYEVLVGKLSVSGGSVDPNILSILLLDADSASVVLSRISKQSSIVTMLARAMQDIARNDKESSDIFLVPNATPTTTVAKVRVPQISTNMTRHFIRETLAHHMLNELGVGWAELPSWVAALLTNGGNIKYGGNPQEFTHKRTIKALYPMLELVGGCVPSFIMDSAAAVQSTLITLEHAAILQRFGVAPEVSAFDLLTDTTNTRHDNDFTEGNQMPFSAEALMTGSKFFIGILLEPHISLAATGAAVLALQILDTTINSMGAAGARGYGAFVFEPHVLPDDADEAVPAYLEHLAANADEMRRGLLTGSLGTGVDLGQDPVRKGKKTAQTQGQDDE